MTAPSSAINKTGDHAAQDLVSVRYLVDDVERALAFYTTHLGFKKLTSFPPGFADVVRGNLRLLLSGPQSSAGRSLPDGRRPEGGGWNRIHLIVDDIQAEVVRLRAAGVTFRSDVVKGPGGTQIVLDDPSGNPVELFQPASVASARSVRVLRDLPYVRDADARQSLDLYVPQRQGAPSPVLISAPGGGLVEGDKANDAHIGQRFAEAGFVTAVVNYRLSPDVAHPRHAEDLAAAVAWVHRNIREYGGDPERLVLTGHSAGAYLATLLVTDRSYLRALGVSIEQIRGLVAVSGFYWVERVAPGRDKRIWGDSLDAWRAASPSHHLHAELPPALFVYADGDDADRQAQNIEIAKAAREAGNSAAESRLITGRDHRSLWKHVADAEDPLATQILAFLKARA